MRTSHVTIIGAAAIWTLACTEPPTPSGPRAITREEEAKAALQMVAAVCQQIIAALPDSFLEPYIAGGPWGRAAVTGFKTTTCTTYTFEPNYPYNPGGSGYSNDSLADLSIAFSAFGTSPGSTMTGSAACSHVGWYYYACQHSCTAYYQASDTLAASGLAIEFEYGSALYRDSITFHAARSTASQVMQPWVGSFTTGAGTTFTFALW